VSVKYTASLPPSRADWVKRLVLILVVVTSLLTPLLPTPSLASTEDVVVAATVSLSPLEVIISTPARVRVNTVFRVDAIVRNRGDSSINKAVAAIYLPKDVELVGSKPDTKLGTIQAHTYATAVWRVRALKKGNYAILVSASGRYGGAIVTGQDVALVTVAVR
jgi:hypothetical protein